MQRDQFQIARELIQAQRYGEARQILQAIDHPKAREWLQQLADLERSPANFYPAPSAPQPAPAGYGYAMPQPASAMPPQLAPKSEPAPASVSSAGDSFSLHGFLLNAQGVSYEIGVAWWAWLLAYRLRDKGFIPLQDLTSLAYVTERRLGRWSMIFLSGFLQVAFASAALLFGGVLSGSWLNLMPLVLASFSALLIAVLIWAFAIHHVLVVYSHGEELVKLEMSRREAEQAMAVYYRLKP